MLYLLSKQKHIFSSNCRIGHLEEAARDLGVAVEMSKEDDVKANLCQKLVNVGPLDSFSTTLSDSDTVHYWLRRPMGFKMCEKLSKVDV